MIPFWKMHGIGNDFVVVDHRDWSMPTPAEIVALCHRTQGVGADGLISIQVLPDLRAKMRMWNPDGSESGMCGNGLRCSGHWLNRNCAQGDWTVALGSSEYLVTRSEGQYAVAMGSATDSPSAIGLEEEQRWLDRAFKLGEIEASGTTVALGNPHLVFFVDHEPRELLSEAQPWETDSRFKFRVNVHIARVLPDQSIQMVTWERGAGPTLACGSGACAVADAAFRTNRITGNVMIHLPGGDLTILRIEDQLTMLGAAEFVYRSEWAS